MNSTATASDHADCKGIEFGPVVVRTPMQRVESFDPGIQFSDVVDSTRRAATTIGGEAVGIYYLGKQDASKVQGSNLKPGEMDFIE